MLWNSMLLLFSTKSLYMNITFYNPLYIVSVIRNFLHETFKSLHVTLHALRLATQGRGILKTDGQTDGRRQCILNVWMFHIHIWTIICIQKEGNSCQMAWVFYNCEHGGCLCSTCLCWHDRRTIGEWRKHRLKWSSTAWLKYKPWQNVVYC